MFHEAGAPAFCLACELAVHGWPSIRTKALQMRGNCPCTSNRNNSAAPRRSSFCCGTSKSVRAADGSFLFLPKRAFAVFLHSDRGSLLKSSRGFWFYQPSIRSPIRDSCNSVGVRVSGENTSTLFVRPFPKFGRYKRIDDAPGNAYRLWRCKPPDADER